MVEIKRLVELDARTRSAFGAFASVGFPALPTIVSCSVELLFCFGFCISSRGDFSLGEVIDCTFFCLGGYVSMKMSRFLIT